MKKLIACLWLLFAAMLTHAQTLPSPAFITQSVGTNSTKAATTAFVANHEGCKNILDSGGNNGGSVDNSSAFSAAAALGPSGKACVYFPPGTYAFSSKINYTLSSGASLTIVGAGIGVTNLVWASAGGLEVNYGNNQSSVHIRDISVLSGTTNTGTGISLYNSGSSGNAESALSTIDSVSINGSDGIAQTNYWSIGLTINNVSNVNVKDLTVVGAGASYQTNGTGAYIEGSSSSSQAVQINFVAPTFDYIGVGISYGQYAQGVTVSSGNFTGDNIGIYIPTPSASQSGLSVTLSQFNCLDFGIYDGVGVAGVFINNNYFEIPYNSGTTVVGINLAKVYEAIVAGNIFERIGSSATNLNGIVIDGPSSVGAMVSGNLFASLGTAIWLQSTSTNVNVQSNSYSGNGSNVTNSSSSACPATSSANCVGGGSQ